MAANNVRGISAKFANKTSIVLVIGMVSAVVAAGCSSDSSDDGAKAGAGTGGAKASAGNAGKVTSGGSEETAGAPPVGEGGAAGSGDVTPVDEGGAAGAAGEAGETPFTAHLSPTLTPKTVSITTGGHDRFYGVTFDSDDNIYAVGVTAAGFTATADFATVVAKFSPEGVLDTTFGSDGFAVRNVAVGLAGELARSIVLQPDGKIVISTTIEAADVGADPKDRDIALLRYLPNGKKDTTFGVDGIVRLPLSMGVAATSGFLADSVWGMDMYPDGRLVLNAGLVAASKTDTDFAIIRLSKDGVPDETFGTHGIFTLDTLFNNASNNASPRNVTILPGTQGIIGAGYQPIKPADTEPCVYRVTDKGKLDTTFGVQGVFSEAVYPEQTETYAAVLQSTGKLVTTGYARQTDATTEKTGVLSMRLNANGKRDLTYGTAGAVKIDVAGFGDNSRKLVVLPNDHVILAGGGHATVDNVDGFVAALDENGKPETTFAAAGWKTIDLGGPADFLWGVALSPSKTRVAFVGIKGAGSAVGATDDDAVLIVSKLVP